MAAKRIVVVGGGFGGAAAARTARRILDAEHEVVLIDRMRRTYLCGGFPLLIAGEREPEKLSRSLGTLSNRGIRYVQAEVHRIETGARRVETGEADFDYDYLVLASGAEYDWDAVPGSAGAYSFYSLDTARRLRRRLARFKKGRIVIGVASLPYKCPPAPFEAAMVLDWLFRERGVRKYVDIQVFTPEPQPLKVAGPEATAKLQQQMARRGIRLHAGAGVTKVDSDGRGAVFSDGSALEADIVMTVPAHRPAAIVREAGLAGESGWVPVDARTLEAAPGLFAIGDTNSVLMGNGMPIPKAGVFASSEGETVGQNIAAEILGREPVAFPGEGYCPLAVSGTSAAILEGSFLAPEKPRVTYRAPSSRGMRRKERFEQDWRRFRV
jgi:sulfide:quinone oxidoreductase